MQVVIIDPEHCTVGFLNCNVLLPHRVDGCWVDLQSLAPVLCNYVSWEDSIHQMAISRLRYSSIVVDVLRDI